MAELLTKTEKKIRIRTGKRVNYEVSKFIPDIGWWRKFNEFLAMIINKAKL